MYVILLGPPGSGKGTQSSSLAAALGVPVIATGDMFREAVREGAELGRLAQQYMEKGELVPDEVTTKMFLERIDRDDARDGAILDGFPRTQEQAAALERALDERDAEVSIVLYFDVSDDTVQRRLGGRWSCPGCGAVYHEVNEPPKRAGVCDRCSGALTQRDDDTPAAVAERLRVYKQQTAPLIETYEQDGLLARVNADQAPEQVRHAIRVALGQAE